MKTKDNVNIGYIQHKFKGMSYLTCQHEEHQIKTVS